MSSSGCPYLSSQVESVTTSERKDNSNNNISNNCYYHSYLQLDTILNSNKPRSKEFGELNAHDEHLFITTHQIYELWFKQIIYDLKSCIEMIKNKLDDENIITVVQRFVRINKIIKLMVDQFEILETMTPMDFLDFRRFLYPASGFQSVQFRKLENMLGLTNDRRTKYNQKEYNEALSNKHSKEVKESEIDSSLFNVLENWLERCPYTNNKHFNFWKEYKQAVFKSIENEKKLLPSKELGLEYEKNAIETFSIVFDENKYSLLKKSNKVRISHKAFKSGLMINLYRHLPVYQMPFKLLENILDLDNLLTKWRHTHALMVHRMLGSKMGTGGSSGFHYLRTAAFNHRVFRDLFNFSTYMIPKSFLPKLPKETQSIMSFTPKFKAIQHTHNNNNNKNNNKKNNLLVNVSKSTNNLLLYDNI